MDINYFNEFLFPFLQMFLLAAFAPLVSGITKKTKALLQKRRGADISQDYYDLRKWWENKRQSLHILDLFLSLRLLCIF